MTTCPHCGAALAPGTPCGRCASQPPLPAEGAGRLPHRDKSRDYALVGKTIADKYKVLDVLGQGAFGTVFLVEITAGMVGEKLALKILPSELGERQAFRTQFLQEIRTAMRLVDRNIVQIRDVGATEDGLLYYTMDYCPGTTLGQVLRREGKISIVRALLLMTNVLRALQTAHAAGIVHRDMKPANIMVEEQSGKETVRVLDFGIATAVQAKGEKGQLAGTPAYMPPEQFLGTEVGFHSDLYSVGAVLYECVTGQKPHGSGSPKEVFQSIKTKQVTPPEQLNPEVAAFPGLSEVILKCLERNPERRYGSARDLFDALNEVLVHGATAEPDPPARTSVPAARPAAPPRPPRPAPQPSVAARKAAERIRQSRGTISSRRSGSRAAGILVGLLILGAVVAGVVFHRELAEILGSKPPAQEGAAPAPKAPGAPKGSSAAVPKEPAPKPATGPEGKASPVAPKGPPSTEATVAEAKKQAQAESIQRFIEQARKAFESKDWPSAASAAQRVLQFAPESIEALRIAGLAALYQRDVTTAETLLERARSLAAKEPGTTGDREVLAALVRAKIEIVPPKIDEAEAIARGLVDVASSSPADVVLLASVLQKAGRKADLEKLIREARAREPGSSEIQALWEEHVIGATRERWKQAQDLLVQARAARKGGQTARALELAGKSSSASWSAAADLLAVECLVELDRLDEALKLGGTARERAKTELETNVLATGAIDERRPPPDVAKRLEGAIDLVQATRLLTKIEATAGGSQELEAKALAEAESALQRAAAARGGGAADDPLAPRLSLELARVASHRGASAQVKAQLRAIAGSPPAALRWRMAEIWLRTARNAPAEDRTHAWGEAAALLSPLAADSALPQPRRAEARYLLAKCHLEVGEPADDEKEVRQALEGFERADREGLATPELHEDWSRAYAYVGNLIRAAQCLRRAYELDPSPSRCLRAVQAYREANPESREAKELLEEGRRRFPEATELRGA